MSVDLDLVDSAALVLNVGWGLVRHFALPDTSPVFAAWSADVGGEESRGEEPAVVLVLVAAVKFVVEELDSVDVLTVLGSGSRIFPAKFGSVPFDDLVVACEASGSV